MRQLVPGRHTQRHRVLALRSVMCVLRGDLDMLPEVPVQDRESFADAMLAGWAGQIVVDHEDSVGYIERVLLHELDNAA